MKFSYLAAMAAFALAGPASAAQIVMGAGNIVGSTPALGSAWAVNNIFDNQTGTIAPERMQDGSFWLARTSGGPGAFITIDLGAVYSNLSFDFFNTHNGEFYDRGIGDFEIFASDTLMSAGANGSTLGGTVRRLVGGTLAAETDNVFDAQTFATDNPVGYRYLQLRPTSVASRAIPNGPYAYGLNELRIYGEPGGLAAVPEPATWAMMIMGFGMAGAAIRRRAALRA